MFFGNPLRVLTPRFLLLIIVLLSASAVQGQVLTFAHNFQVYEEEISFFNVNTMHFQGTSSRRANYLLACAADRTGALQVRRHSTSDTSPLTATGELVCQVSGFDYLEHQYEHQFFQEQYRARYKAHRGGFLPPASVVPDPSKVQVILEARCGDEYLLRVVWFLPKSKPAFNKFDVAKSYYSYTLRCHSLD